VQDVLVIQLNQYEIQERCTDVTVSDYSAEGALKRFIATKRVEGIADSTLRRYADENMKLLRFLCKPLYEIETYDLRFYLSYRRQQGNVSNRTLDGMRRCYSSFFTWLSAEGIIGRNPCAALSQIKYRKTVKKPFSAVELERMRQACRNMRDRALVEFLYATGCRVSEVAKLDIWDVDFDLGECVVLGKGNKERTVYLSPVAAMHLKEYIGHRRHCGDALFTGRGGKRLTKAGIEAAIKRLGEAAGVENAHPHRYRRTLATNLLDRGMNIQDVASILGHADLKTTQIYCYISQTNVQFAYKKYAA
jgi:site-specific recombinase XerD